MENQVARNRAVPIFKFKGESLELDTPALKQVLEAEHVKDKPVVVISVAGAYRKGKSFLLNFLIRYLRKNCQKSWLQGSEDVLDGFSWCGGCERETVGILLWSEVFLVTTPQGKQVAVVLMDTQGTFDGKSTMKESATVFSLSTMLTSTQIYNLSQNIGEDDLQHLQLFCDYGRLVNKEVRSAPFQELLFLIRDWSSPYQFSYGEEGGQALLNKWLHVSTDQPQELRNLRNDIKTSFHTIKCFLMPHPGLKVATDPEFTGRLSDIEPSFKEHLKELMSLILDPSDLHPKRMNGTDISCAQLCTHIQVYAARFKDGKVPGPKSMREATGVANNLTAFAEALDIYLSEMNKLGVGQKCVKDDGLLKTHQQSQESALQKFDSTLKLGGQELEELYRAKLEEAIQKTFDEFLARNKGKTVKEITIGLLKTALVSAGFLVLSAPLAPGLAIGTAVRFAMTLPGFGLTLASSLLGEKIGDLVVPGVDASPVTVPKDQLLQQHIEVGEEPPLDDHAAEKSKMPQRD